MAAQRFRQSWPGALLHPFGVLALLAIQWQALFKKIIGQPMQWKGRAYLPAKTEVKNSPARMALWIIGAMLLLAGPVRVAADGAPVATTNLTCPSFELANQFGTNEVVTFPRTLPTVLIVADRSGAEQIPGWATALIAHSSGRIELIGVADVRGVPGWLQDRIRKKFQKKYARAVLLDWSGRLPVALRCKSGTANVFLLNPAGEVLAAERGECGQDSLARLMAAMDAAKNP